MKQPQNANKFVLLVTLFSWAAHMVKLATSQISVFTMPILTQILQIYVHLHPNFTIPNCLIVLTLVIKAVGLAHCCRAVLAKKAVFLKILTKKHYHQVSRRKILNVYFPKRQLFTFNTSVITLKNRWGIGSVLRHWLHPFQSSHHYTSGLFYTTGVNPYFVIRIYLTLERSQYQTTLLRWSCISNKVSASWSKTTAIIQNSLLQ